jgi:hypothetical protein
LLREAHAHEVFKNEGVAPHAEELRRTGTLRPLRTPSCGFR